MISIPLDPVALRLGPLALTWHGIFAAVGIAAALWPAGRLAPLVGVAAASLEGAVWWFVGGGLVGARLLYAAEHLGQFAGDPLRLLLVHEGGISVFGALLGAAAAGALWARRAGVPAGHLLGLAAPCLLLGQGIGRVGDVINGEHRGVPAPGLPWAVVYTHPNTLGDRGVPVHPAVAYELLWDVAAAGLVVWLLDRGLLPPAGAVWLGLFLYALGRLWVGFFRLDARHALDLGLAQLIGLAALLVAAAGLTLALRQRRRRGSSGITPPP